MINVETWWNLWSAKVHVSYEPSLGRPWGSGDGRAVIAAAVIAVTLRRDTWRLELAQFGSIISRDQCSCGLFWSQRCDSFYCKAWHIYFSKQRCQVCLSAWALSFRCLATQINCSPKDLLGCKVQATNFQERKSGRKRKGADRALQTASDLYCICGNLMKSCSRL